MIITCEKCGGSFNLDEKLLKPGGTKVKCSKCKYIFSAFPPGKERPAIGPSEVELIICEQCGAGFKMKSALLKSEGSKVRCSKCKYIFLAFPSIAGPEPETEEVEIEEPGAGFEEAAEPEQEEGGSDFSLEEEQIEDTVDLPEGLDLEIEEEPEAAEPSGGSGDMELDLDEDEGDLDLEIEEEPEAAEPSGGSGDMELDLDEDEGDLDLEIDEDEDLDLGDEEESEAEPSEASDDMELELDGGEEENGDDGIDFSEVDSLLGTDDVSVMDTVEVSASELDLDLDDDEEGSSVQQQEIDLADLEQTIEMELLEPEEESDEEEPEDVELELADDEGEEDQDEEIVLAEGEEEDFSDIEEMLGGGDDEETIELDLDGEEAAEEAEEDEAGEETVVKGKKAKPAKKKKEKKAKAKKEKKPKAKKEKPKKKGKKSKKLLVAVLVIVFLMVVGLVAVSLVTRSLLYPYIQPYIPPSLISSLGLGQAAPVGSNSVLVMDNTIQSDFIANAKHGKLFIIKGSVKNETSTPKRFIKVVANLYSEGHTLEMTSSAYCGNILGNEALASSDLAAINARLAVKVGDNSRNANVQPGTVIPFMLVIPEMPENLVEYEVLVSDASPV